MPGISNRNFCFDGVGDVALLVREVVKTLLVYRRGQLLAAVGDLRNAFGWGRAGHLVPSHGQIYYDRQKRIYYHEADDGVWQGMFTYCSRSWNLAAFFSASIKVPMRAPISKDRATDCIWPRPRWSNCSWPTALTPILPTPQASNATDLAERRNHTHLARLMEAHIDKKLSIEATKSDIEPLYTVQKVAELLSVDDTFVLDLIKSRKITGLQLDEKTLSITAGSVQRYLAKLATVLGFTF